MGRSRTSRELPRQHETPPHRRKPSGLVILAGVLLATSLLVFPGLFAPARALRTGTCSPTPGDMLNRRADPIPIGAIMIINISVDIVRSEDPGIVGFWALDAYTMDQTVWKAPDGTFYVSQFGSGGWHTFAGALSITGVLEPKDGSGPFGFVETEHLWNETFTPHNSSYPTFGFLGTLGSGGSRSDVLLGSYSFQNVNNSVLTNPSFVSPYTTFFTGAAVGFENYSWAYNYEPDRQLACFIGNPGSTPSSSNGPDTIGDIVT